MINLSHERSRTRRLFRMPQRKSFWLYNYDQIKYRTPLQWSILLAVGVVLTLFGSLGVWSIAGQYNAKHSVDLVLIALTAMCLAMAVIELPAALIFFYRRWQGEITGYFDYEIVRSEDEGRADGVSHGSGHR